MTRGTPFLLRLNTAGRYGREVVIASVPLGAAGCVVLGRADSGASLDVYGLTTNVPSRTRPQDFVYRNVGLRFLAVPVPNAPGIGTTSSCWTATATASPSPWCSTARKTGTGRSSASSWS